MKKTLFIINPILFLLACNVSTTPINNSTISLDSIKVGRETKPVIKEYQGLYDIQGFTFRSCENDAIYYVEDSTMGIDSAIAKIDYLGTVFMKAKGYVKQSTDEQVLVVKKLINVDQKNYKNTCIPYAYWCFGTEPFWQIQISEKENLIDFYNPMEQKQKLIHFEYSKAENNNGEIIFNATNKENKISIIIKKEKCNGAIDPQYDYSVQVTLNTKKYQGCGIKGEK